MISSVLCALIVVGLAREGFGFTLPSVEEALPTPVAVEPVREPDSLQDALSRLAPELDPEVLELALQSQQRAVREGLVPNPTTLTVIDYSRPSIEPRFYVFDLEAKQLVFEELVAHGKNSGNLMATRFSNAEQSLQTSLGLFVTRDTYRGKHGYSLRLDGLEPGFNDNALSRAIVIHAADYVSPATVAKLGFIGRSWGCPALPPAANAKVIDRIRGGSAVFAYYPDGKWLSSSRFIEPEAPSAGAYEMPGDEFVGQPVATIEPHTSL